MRLSIFGAAAILTTLALGACQTTQKSNLNITDNGLKRAYIEVLRCANSNFSEENVDLNDSASVEGGVESALVKCDLQLTVYGNSLAERVLVDNGWGRYTQPVPQYLKLGARSRAKEALVKLYMGLGDA